jgi:4-hydroxy-3-methylbut-2-en-1-yl diphosphate synthase IspG/GcpE
VIAEKRNKKLRASVLKYEPLIAITAAFKELASQLTDAETAVHMGLTEAVQQIAKSQQALCSFVLWQLAQATDDRGVDGKELTQAPS